mmetsp:Transcript_92731/g.198787  ORF Transcript_92731/g.198787 Transcript_92731/m.198787 type:complete len:224 (+) Transcript_92731:77-748(+)|eukprot:CAMPEP_0180419446 /NCGR_PEP_ID=MMETSP1036_2-20121128/2100_1 /TAXON_ID=632150 /ORGANISM="Azadinium spinosum, Strain 3D9" /LENGTH=223 /DNA_ID=CAMNT_0022424601 /DNA_START=11 /DNA_END=682 /DNA_ORIENTATION=+
MGADDSGAEVLKASASPTGRGRQQPRSFWVWMALCNLCSVLSIFAWASGVLTVLAACWIEVVVLVIKFIGEVVHDDLSPDIWVHHIAELVGIVLILSDTWGTREVAQLVPICNLIHLPLLLTGAKRLQARGRVSTLCDVLYLFSWLPVVLIRDGYLAFLSLQEVPATRGSVLLVFAIAFVGMDVFWTPWGRYKSMIERTLQISFAKRSSRELAGAFCRWTAYF